MNDNDNVTSLKKRVKKPPVKNLEHFILELALIKVIFYFF